VQEVFLCGCFLICTYNEQLVSILKQFFILEFKMTQYIWYIPFENPALIQGPFLD
jgi:hypothetical protein